MISKEEFGQFVGAAPDGALVQFAANAAGLTSAHAVREQLMKVWDAPPDEPVTDESESEDSQDDA